MYSFVSCYFFGEIIGNFASFDNSSAFRNLEWNRKITLSSNGLNGCRELLFRIDYLGLSAATSKKTRFCISLTISSSLFFSPIGCSPTVHCSNSAILDGFNRSPLFWGIGWKLGSWLLLCRFPGFVASNVLYVRAVLTPYLLLPSWKTYDSANLLRYCVKSSNRSNKNNFRLTAKLLILFSRDVLHLTILIRSAIGYDLSVGGSPLDERRQMDGLYNIGLVDEFNAPRWDYPSIK